MAKTIRSHPTSPFYPPRTNCLDYSYILKFGPKMDLRFLHFPTCRQVNRLAPKGKKMRMDHPFILGFCQNVTFDMVFTIIFLFFGQNPLSLITVIF